MDDRSRPALSRRLNLSLLTLYGLGTTIGAGIFVLVGKVAGRAGMAAPFSFLVACVLAAFTAFSFAELAGRYPRSAGEALYVREGFGSRSLALAVGLMVVLSGVISSAAIVGGAAGYLQLFLPLPHAFAIFLTVTLLAVLALWGIGESVTVASLFTLLEIGGLLMVIWGARDSLGTLPVRGVELIPPFEAAAWIGVAAGAMLAFFAFLGFEDMVNVAEEVRDVTRTMPVAILLTLGITALLYALVATASVLTVPPEELAASAAPLALVSERSGGGAGVVSIIAIFAVLNGALIQMIMGSRVIYGLADQSELPRVLAYVSARTRTPIYATLLVATVILLLALFLPLEMLAETTSAIVLAVFTLVNLALVMIKFRGTPPPTSVRSWPIWIPIAGFLSSLGFLIVRLIWV